MDIKTESKDCGRCVNRDICKYSNDFINMAVTLSDTLGKMNDIPIAKVIVKCDNFVGKSAHRETSFA